MDRDPGLTTELAPLETALMAAARNQAERQLHSAEAKAAATVADGAAKARDLLERAAAEGRRAAERAAEHRLVDGRRQARELVLAAQKAAYQRLVSRAVAAAEGLTSRSEYGDLERRLIDTAKSLLGPDAAVVTNPDGRGGVRASSGGRSVDLTLGALARRCVERLGQEVTRLWA
jgi:vacuolar-type H+-ATPase subunit E/Vma4